MRRPRLPHLRNLLLVGLLATAVRFGHLYEIWENPFARHPVGVATVFAGETPRTDAGVGQPLTASPGYTHLLSLALGAMDGALFPVYVLQAVVGATVCLLLYGLAAAIFSPAIGLASGVAAALYGPAIYFGAELTPTLWVALLQLLFLLSVVSPPCRGACRWLIATILLSMVLVESLPLRNLTGVGDLGRVAGNFYYLIQGRELLPDLDPYLARRDSFVIAALLWDKWLAFPFGAILPLAMFGAVVCGRGSWGEKRGEKALRVFILLSALTFGLFAPDARHRLPVALLLLPFAAQAVAIGARYVREKKKTALCICLLVTANLSFVPPERLAGSFHHFYWMGSSYARQGMTANAISAYLQALERSPTHYSATRELAELYIRRGDPAKALATCATYLRAHPGSPEILLLQGDAFVAAGRPDDALATYEELRRSSAGPAVDLLVRLGETYRLNGQINRATDTYGEAVSTAPDSSGLRHRLAQLYEVGGRTERAVEQYRLLLAQDPGNHEYHARLGGLLFDGASGDSLFHRGTAAVEEAEGHLNEAIRLRGDYLPARQLLVRLLGRQERYLEAVPQLERLLELRPDDHEAHYRLGKMMGLAGMHEEAQRHLDIHARMKRMKEIEDFAQKQLQTAVEQVAPEQRR